MRDILQIVGAVISIANMILIDIFAVKKFRSSHGDEQAKQLLCAGLIFGSIVGILIFVVFNAISKIF